MTTFQSNRVSSSYQPIVQYGLIGIEGRLTIGTAPVANDVYQLFKIPAGAVLTHLKLVPSDMDTDGTPALLFNVGDGADPDRYLVDSTLGQSTTVVTLDLPIVANGWYEYTADDTIDLQADTAAATFAAGTIDFFGIYNLRN